MQTVRVPANYQYLAEISKFVGDAAREADMDAASVYAVQLAVDEACSNIIEHAYGEQGGGEIECTCETVANGLKITLYDQGNPFNPEDIPELDLHAKLDEIEPLYGEKGKVFNEDDGVRPDSSVEKLAKLKPFFDRPYGKVTPANSSQITDGASSLILASEDAIKKHKLTPIAKIR